MNYVRPVKVERDRRARLLRWNVGLALMATLTAGAAEPLPHYAPERRVAGTIRLWGHGSFKHDFMGKLVRGWMEDFSRYQPEVRLENRLYGTGSAIGALYTGSANLAILGEEISPAAAAAFRRYKHYDPTAIQIATGSLDVSYFDYAHMIFVNRANPLSQLSLAQLDGIFGAEHRRGSRNLRTWGDLGLTGEWATRPIQTYSWPVDEDFGLFFSSAVLQDSHRWNENVKEFRTQVRADGSAYDHGRQILEALAKDPAGIAISNVRYAGPEVKALALARADGGPYVAATRATLVAQSYPLTRIISALVDRPPGQPVDPAVREFLRYILSREGQAAITAESDYLPLGPGFVPAQRAKLGEDNSIRIWGSDQMAGVVARWAEGFRATDPEARIETNLRGSDTGMAGLETGQADIALLGRECTPSELQAFEWIYRYAPTRTEIMTGSWTASGKSPALAIFVRRDNPRTHLTLGELQTLFAAGRPTTLSHDVIRLYGSDSTSGTGRYFRRAVLAPGQTFNWSQLTEFSDGHAVISALEKDSVGIAVASLDCATPEVRAVPLALTDGGPYLLPTAQTVAARSYPLSRPIIAVTNRPPSGPISAPVAKFLQYVLSPAGQQAVAAEGDYLPLPSP